MDMDFNKENETEKNEKEQTRQSDQSLPSHFRSERKRNRLKRPAVHDEEEGCQECEQECEEEPPLGEPNGS